MPKSNKNKGGIFRGNLHKTGGIPKVVNGNGQFIEVEKDEPLIPSEALDNKKIKKRQGTNIEILDKINKESGAKGMTEPATKVHAGDAIVCRKSTYDGTKRTYIGTDKQIVSAINESGGCKKIEGGAKAIEPDGSVTQYKKGGDVVGFVGNKRWDRKKKQIEELANNIQRLKYSLTKDLKSENERDYVTAVAILLMMSTGERIGNDDSASNGHYGITGLKKKHIKIDGSTIYMNYIGKSGVEHDKEFADKNLSKHLKKVISKSPNSYIFTTSDGFRIKSDRINRYLSEFSVSGKDIRGFSANKWVIDKLKKVEIPDTEKERKVLFNKAAKQVATKIGHGVPTLKKHYLMPELVDKYVYDSEIINPKEATTFASGGKLGLESIEKRIINSLDDKKRIKFKDLQHIMGRDLKYPYENIGNIKLEKCFLIPYYRVVNG